MYCKNCGNYLDDQAVICPKCGASTGSPAFMQPAPIRQPAPKVTFGQAIRLFFSQYATFGGRSRRSEYWYAALFNYLVVILCYILLIVSAATESEPLTVIAAGGMILYALAILLPNLAITVRRLHDIGRSGWWYFISWIPYAGNIVLLVFCCMDSTEDTQWGKNPKYL